MHEFKQQVWHFLSNLGLTLLVFVPFLNCLVVLLWAFSREYYQKKSPVLSFWENIPPFNTDLFWSSIGIVVGLLISTGIWAHILLKLI